MRGALLDDLNSRLLFYLLALLILVVPVTRYGAAMYVRALRRQELPQIPGTIRVVSILSTTIIFLSIYVVTMTTSGYAYGNIRAVAIIYSYAGFLGALASPILLYCARQALGKALICPDNEVKRHVNLGSLLLSLVIFYVVTSLFVQLLH